MGIKEIKDNELQRAIDLYITHRNSFKGLLSFEDFTEQYLHRCDTCGNIICILYMCSKCD